MANSEASFLAVGDTHCGHKCGLMPDEYYLKSSVDANTRGNKIEASPLQAEMYRAWCAMVDMERYNVVAHLGDGEEGTNKKENGRGCWTTDVGEQSECNANLISMIKYDHGQLYGVAGSGYHVGTDGDADRTAMKLVGGHFDLDIFLNVNKLRIFLRHEVGYSSIPHGRSTAISKEMLNAKLQYPMYGDINVYLFGHTHYTHDVGWEGQRGIIVPCMKYRDSFVRKKSFGGNDLGYVVLYIEDGQYTWQTYSFKIGKELGITEFTYEFNPDEPSKNQHKPIKVKKSKDRVRNR